MKIDPVSLKAVENMLTNDHRRQLIIDEAAFLGPGVLEFLNASEVKISSLEPGKHLSDYTSKAKEFGIRVPVRASGVFVPSAATLYIVTDTKATAVHELAHALDYAFAREKNKDSKPNMMSHMDKEFAKNLVGNGIAPTQYGQTNTQEFFAESLRAYCGIDNVGSVFSATSPAKLRSLNRQTFLFMTKMMCKLNGRRFEGKREYRTEYLPSSH